MYHFSVDVVKRSDGRSMLAAAAYPSGARLTDVRLGKTFDYGRKRGIVAAHIMAPAGAPEWVHDRGQLWNRVETTEKRKDAQLARQIVISLPAELSSRGRIRLIFEFVRAHFVEAGMVADVALHDPDAANPQPHAHVHLTMRRLDADGFGPKAREWNDTALLEGWRVAWAKAANAALEAEGHAGRLDHRSLEAQRAEWAARAEAAPDPRARQRALIEVARLTYIPQPSIGRAAWAAMAKGQDDDPRFASRIAEWRAAVASKDAAEAEANRLTAALEAEIAAERAMALAAAEARRATEERERLAAQAAQARAWAAEMTGGGLAELRRRADAPARFAAARDAALGGGDLVRAGRAEAARQAWHGAATAAREIMAEVKGLEALKADPLARAAAAEIEPPAARAVRAEVAAGGGWAASLRTFIREASQIIRDALTQFHARRASAPVPRPSAPSAHDPDPWRHPFAEPPAPRPAAPRPAARKPVPPPAPARKPPPRPRRIVFADLPAQGLAAFEDWKRLVVARMLWERDHNRGRGPLIDYMNVLAGQDLSYEPLFEGLRANWQNDPAHRAPMLDLLARIGGSFDPATGRYDPEPPPPFRPNDLLVSAMATARERRGGRLTVPETAAVVRAVAAYVSLTIEDVAAAAPEFSRDTDLPRIWRMAQEPAPRAAPAPPASGPSRRKPDWGPGW